MGDIVAELQNTDFAGAYDAVGSSILQVIDVVAQLGGGKVVTVGGAPESGTPSTVEVSRGEFLLLRLLWFVKVADMRVVFGIPIGSGNDVGESIYGDFLPYALQTGQFRPMPPAKVVGEGLESIQGAMDLLKKGVSASKLVVRL